MTDERERSVLIAEDDERTCAFLADNLRADGFRVACASGAGEAIRQIEVRGPDLLLLDVTLEAGSSGLEVLDRVRSADGLSSRIDPDIPVILLTGRAGEADRVRGFERGADDFVPKPFLYGELLWRVRALLRRSRTRSARGVVHVGELTVDPVSRRVRIGGRLVHLSAKEFALLHTLASEPARVFTKQELLRDVWGYASMGTTRTLDAHACRVRKKLGPGPRPWMVNLRGVGYRLTEAL